MRATISKQTTFSAAHRLDQLPEEHKCHRLHGHNYRVVVELTGPVDERGMVRDYADLGGFFAVVHSALDHRCLNDVMLAAPTAENLAAWLYERAHAMLGIADDESLRIRVSETDNTWAWFPA